MRLTTAILLTGFTLLTVGCSQKEETERPSLERAQEKLQASIDTAEARLAEGKAEARKALDAAMQRWEKEFRPQAEKAIASLEERVNELARDSEALKRLPPDVLEQARKHLDAMRENWWEELRTGEAAHYEGDFDRDEPNYRRGYEAALHPQRRGRAYADAEDELRGAYAGTVLDRPFKSGYERGLSHRPNEVEKRKV